MEYMQTLAFILIIAALVQFVEMVIQKVSPSLYQALGVYFATYYHKLCCAGCSYS